jgi:hypothetical protein
MDVQLPTLKHWNYEKVSAASWSGCTAPGERALNIHWTEDWNDHKTTVDMVMKIKL